MVLENTVDETYRVYHSKGNPTTITYCVQKLNQKQVHPRVIDSTNLPRDTRVMVSWLLGRCSRQMRKSYAGANMVYSRAERVFILEHCFAWNCVKHVAMRI
jgi:hypothetical protein